MTRRTLMITMGAAWLLGCGAPTTEVPEQEATVACGLCRFHMEGATSCFWAVELNGEHYAVVGANQPDHESHGPDGMCVMDRRAVVAGEVKRDKFIAQKFELIPATGITPGAAPPAHDHEH